MEDEDDDDDSPAGRGILMLRKAFALPFAFGYTFA